MSVAVADGCIARAGRIREFGTLDVTDLRDRDDGEGNW
jgi:hypothetical protein